MKTGYMNCPRCGGSGKVLDPRSQGREMRERRIATDRTQTEVAVSMGISKAYLSDLELGRRGWNAGLIERYERALRK